MVGLESTVVDGLNEDGNIRVLRPGGVTVEDIEMALREETRNGISVPRVLVHERDYRDQTIEIAPSTPGMKYRHYSPSIPVILLFTLSPPPPGITVTPIGSFLMALRNGIPNARTPLRVGLLVTANSQFAQNMLPDEGIQWIRHELGPASEPWTIAHHLFDGLLTLECEGVDIIIAEEVPEAKEGLAVMNRLKKAASEFVWVEHH
jgi:L-threonylcarbamoyladenylate synthase